MSQFIELTQWDLEEHGFAEVTSPITINTADISAVMPDSDDIHCYQTLIVMRSGREEYVVDAYEEVLRLLRTVGTVHKGRGWHDYLTTPTRA